MLKPPTQGQDKLLCKNAAGQHAKNVHMLARFWEAVSGPPLVGKPFLENRFGKPFLGNRLWETVVGKPFLGNRFGSAEEFGRQRPRLPDPKQLYCQRE